jgi:ribosomal protein S5
MVTNTRPAKVNESELKERVVAINRVAKVVKGGRRFSFAAIIVVGDGNESAGIRDVLAKSKGSSNPHNVVKATIDALLKMRAPHQVAFQRGVKLSKVFNG